MFPRERNSKEASHGIDRTNSRCDRWDWQPGLLHLGNRQDVSERATGIGITCLVLLLCCGLGGLIAFIFGWVKNKEWGITNIMFIWTGCVILSVISNFLAPTDYSAAFQQFK
jgi:hypothetical protein